MINCGDGSITISDRFCVKNSWTGGSPGLVVMGGDSYSKGREFESRRRLLDGNGIFHIDLL